ncbi:WxL protein peptidoglycan domain-containing protein [Arthrobacter sp. TMT4-20]
MPQTSVAATGDSVPDLSWSIRPGTSDGTARTNFTYTVQPGESIRDSVIVTNTGTTPLNLEVYAADGMTSVSGHLDLQPASETPTDVASWFTAEDQYITVQPGDSEEVPFTLDIPADGSPGDHVGGVVTSYVSETSQGTVKLDRRLATRLNVRVSGDEVVDLEISDLDIAYPVGWNPFVPTEPTITYTVTNKGNVRTHAEETAQVAGLIGEASTLGASIDELVPGASATRSVTVQGAWPMFVATGTVTITPTSVGGSAGAPVTTDVTVPAIPWSQLILLVLVAATVLLIARNRAASAPHSALDKCRITSP